MPPVTTYAGLKNKPSRQNVASQASQQTIHVGLQIDQSSGNHSPRGSVAAARWRAQSQMNPSSERGFALNPRSFEDMHDGLGSGSRLESPSDSDEGSMYGDEKPPWNTIKTSSSIRTRERSDSDETLHLPRMGSRDFYPEKKSTAHDGMPVGFAR